MQPRKIIVIGGGAALLGLLGYLLLQVGAEPKSGISDEKKARAMAEYERRNALANANVEPDVDSDEGAPTRRRSPFKRPTRMELPSTGPAASDRRPSTAPRPIPRPMSTSAMSIKRPSVSVSSGKDDPELKNRMKEVSAAYDRGEYDEAHDLVVAVLKDSPRNIKMLRYGVSTSCAVGDLDHARDYLSKLPTSHQNQMRSRCKRWSVDL